MFFWLKSVMCVFNHNHFVSKLASDNFSNKRVYVCNSRTWYGRLQ